MKILLPLGLLLALSGCASITEPSNPTSSSSANPVYTEEELIEATGYILNTANINLIVDHDNEYGDCAKPGFYGAFYPRNGEALLLICNRHTDWAETLDTIKHELVHAAQWCRGGSTGPFVNLNLVDISYQAALRVVHNYAGESPYAQLIEAEAFTMASSMSFQSIVEVLAYYCYN